MSAVRDIADEARAELAKLRELGRAHFDALEAELEEPALVSAAPRVKVAAETNLAFRSPVEIAQLTSSEIAWVFGYYVARGAITELSGKVKSAGKTTFMLAGIRAVLDGLMFLGLPTVQSPVVLLTEMGPSALRQALQQADLLDRSDLRILSFHDAIGVPWPTVVKAAREEARRIGAQFLAVDTLGQWAGLSGDSENDSGAAMAAALPLQEAASVDQLAVLALRHDRKSGGDVGDSARGSSAFSGAVDVVLRLRRGEGNTRPTIRIIDALSRFDETPDQFVIELRNGQYVALGDSQAVAAAEARAAILAAAPAADAEALREADLLAAADVKRTIGQDAIREHLEAGRLRRSGTGKRGDPYRYWRPENDQFVSAVPPVVPAERNGHVPESNQKLSAGTSVLWAAETNGLDPWEADPC